jgi:cell division protein FtsL
MQYDMNQLQLESTQLQLKKNQLQLDLTELQLARREPTATTRVFDCNCDTILIATRRN